MTASFELWLDQQYRRAAAAMLVSVSPVGIVKSRAGFGQIVRPVRGSIVASPVPAD
jgi:glucoamylase